MNFSVILELGAAIAVIAVAALAVYMVMDRKDRFVVILYWIWIGAVLCGLAYAMIDTKFWKKKTTAQDITSVSAAVSRQR